MPTRCNRGFYCRSYCLLNIFRAPLRPSSGVQEYYTMVAACGISCCGFQVAVLTLLYLRLFSFLFMYNWKLEDSDLELTIQPFHKKYPIWQWRTTWLHSIHNLANIRLLWQVTLCRIILADVSEELSACISASISWRRMKLKSRIHKLLYASLPSSNTLLPPCEVSRVSPSI